MAKTDSRLLYAALIIRWIALSIGFLLFFYKLGGGEPALLESFFVQHAPLFAAVLTAYAAAMSLFQIRGKQNTVTAFVIVFADLLSGAFLVYAAGQAFFPLSLLPPILEAFLYFDATGAFIAVFDLLLIASIVAQNRAQIGAPALLGTEILVIIPLVIVFLLAKKQEQEAHVQQNEIEQEKTTIRSELSQAHDKIENLYRDLLASQNELETWKSKSESSLEIRQEEAKQQLQEARQHEAEAIRNAKELSREFESLKKEKENLHFLLETSGQFHAGLHLEEVLISIVKTLQRIFNFQTCVIFLTDQVRDQTKLYAEVAASANSDYFRNYAVGLGEGLVGWVAQEKEPRMIEHGSLLTADGHEFSTLLTNEQSALAAPILNQDKSLLGVIYLGQVEARAYSWQDINLLLRFIPHIQAAILRAEQYHQAIAQGVLDPTTGLYNRLYFEERLSEEIKRAYRYQVPLSLIFLALDDYAGLQAHVDEPTMKQLITEMGELLRTYLRDVDVLAYLGEDKFGIMLVQAERLNAVLIAERIRMAIELREFGKNAKRSIKLTVSVGVAGYPKDALHKPDLLAKGNAGLAEAIAKGGNKTCIP